MKYNVPFNSLNVFEQQDYMLEHRQWTNATRVDIGLEKELLTKYKSVGCEKAYSKQSWGYFTGVLQFNPLVFIKNIPNFSENDAKIIQFIEWYVCLNNNKADRFNGISELKEPDLLIVWSNFYKGINIETEYENLLEKMFYLPINGEHHAEFDTVYIYDGLTITEKDAIEAVDKVKAYAEIIGAEVRAFLKEKMGFLNSNNPPIYI
jgi:hypothetical protein